MARRGMLAPINSVKHIVQRFVTTVATAAVLNDVIVNAVVASAVSDPTEVQEGSVIKAVFVEMWLAGTGASGISGAFNLTVEKYIADQPDMTSAQSLNLMTYPNKKNILYTTQGLIASDEGSPAMPLIRQWIKIPKGKQRFGLGDRLLINLANVSNVNFSVCGVYIYKAYQ